MKILLVRHGYDDFDAGESSMGRGQMVMDADVMKSTNLLNGDVRVIASEFKRTMASAEIVATELGVVGVEEVSWLTDGTEENTYAELMKYAKKYAKRTTVIAITHLPEIENILEELQRDFKTHIDMDAGYGDVYIIDTDKKLVKRMEVLQ